MINIKSDTEIIIEASNNNLIRKDPKIEKENYGYEFFLIYL